MNLWFVLFVKNALGIKGRFLMLEYLRTPTVEVFALN